MASAGGFQEGDDEEQDDRAGDRQARWSRDDRARAMTGQGERNAGERDRKETASGEYGERTNARRAGRSGWSGTSKFGLDGMGNDRLRHHERQVTVAEWGLQEYELTYGTRDIQEVTGTMSRNTGDSGRELTATGRAGKRCERMQRRDERAGGKRARAGGSER